MIGPRRRYMEITSINVAPGKGDGLFEGGIVFIFQGVRCLEDYVGEFLDTCHHATCSDLTLIEGFWVGLDKEIRMVMPRGDPV